MANIVLDFLHNYQTGERRETEPANAYQYDEGHVLEAVLPEVITSAEIHYWIRGMEEADAYTPTSITPNADNSCTVLGNIPNSYFETNGELRIYIVVTDGTASITTYEGKLHICQRSMPDDYVDDDPENEAVRVIAEARAAAATATEKAGEAAASAEQAQEILDSIPEDYTELTEDVSDLKDDFTNIATEKIPVNWFDGTYNSGKYVNQATGELGNSSSYGATNFIEIGNITNKATVIIYSVSGFRYALYDDNKTYVSGSTVDSSLFSTDAVLNEKYYTIDTTNATYIRFSCSIGSFTDQASSKIMVILGDTLPIRYQTYFEPHVELKEKSLLTVCFGSMPQKATGDMDSLHGLSFNANAVKKNKVFAFYGLITTFTGINVGQGKTSGNGYYLHIDNTNIEFKRNGSGGGIIPHGLTFSDYISVIISVGNDTGAKITINTNGGTYTRNISSWLGSSIGIFADCDAGTVLTGCSLSFSCTDIKKPIWYFGDSYVSWSDDRWPKYMDAYGFLKNILLSGIPGTTSAEAFTSLTNLLALGTPKYIVWAIGMNDADSSNAVNTTWMNVFNALDEICAENDIILIPCTIPNVPSVINTHKNAIVKNSGYSYIDFAKAVGAESTGATWYTGMLSNDNVHPSANGAVALANSIVNDFPIITM